MNRNTILGTLGVALLLILMAVVSQQEAVSINLSQSNNPAENLGDRQSQQETIANVAVMETQINQLASASNGFGFNLLTQIKDRQESNDNIVISPSSIAIALAMTRKGTAGKTNEEMTNTLELSQLEPSTIDLSYQKLMETLQSVDPNVNLAIANSLWVNQNIALKEEFLNNAQKFYLAKVTNLDFADFQAKNTINNWVAENTANKIPEIVDSVSPQDGLYLINAIYFKGIWTKKFEAKQTVEQPFYNDGDTSQPQMMMNQMGDYRYFESDRFQGVRLPYGKKEEVGMYIFLPKATSSLGDFNQQLNLENWQEWLSQMRSQKGNITIPRFKLEYETDLIQSLSGLGIKQIFDPSQADFSAMTDTSVVVDAVKHKTFIEVNEEGTEAAGVTSIGIRITSAQPQDIPFNMNVNRPFFFAIRDDITETILFMGNVVEP